MTLSDILKISSVVMMAHDVKFVVMTSSLIHVI